MSTIKVTNIEHGSTTDGGIQLDSSGHVTIDGQQLPTSGALSNRNLIINGAMQVAQRGTTFTSTNAYGTVDRFKFVSNDTNTQSQESLSTSDTPYSYGFRNYFRLKNTTASSGGDTTYREIDYRVEAQDIASSGWNYTSTSSYITIQFWLRASVSQSYYLHIRSQDGTQRSFVSELAVTADTWKKFEITMPGNSGITFNNDVGLGLLVRFIPWYGTAYTGSGTLDAWTTSSNEVIPDMTDTWGETTNATFDVTGLQLEVGEKATPFEHRSFGDELARCQRYFRRFCEGAQYASAPSSGTGVSSTSAYHNVDLSPEMRSVPTLAAFSNLRTDDVSGGQAITALSVVSSMSSTEAVFLNATSASGLTQYRPYHLLANNTSSAKLDLSAEL